MVNFRPNPCHFCFQLLILGRHLLQFKLKLSDEFNCICFAQLTGCTGTLHSASLWVISLIILSVKVLGFSGRTIRNDTLDVRWLARCFNAVLIVWLKCHLQLSIFWILCWRLLWLIQLGFAVSGQVLHYDGRVIQI